MGLTLDPVSPIRGAAGIVTANIKGNIKELFYVTKFEMNIDITDIEIKAVGFNTVKHKKGMMNISGSLELYSVTSDFINLLIEYKRTGKFPYFILTGSTNDPESDAGTRRVQFTGVSFNTVPLYLMDSGADTLNETIPVVANDFDFLDRFKL